MNDATGTAPRLRPRLLAAGVWIVAAGGIAAWAILEGRGPVDAAASLVDALNGSSWGVLAFIGVFLARPLVLFPATLLTIAGGFLYGPALGIVVVIVASNASAMVAYAIARWFGAGRSDDGHGVERLARWGRRIRTRGFQTIMLMRLLYLPFDLVSYLAGIARVRPLPFLAGTAVGGAPATVAVVLFGASLEQFDGGAPRPDVPVLLTSVAVLVAGLALAEILRRREGAGTAAG